MNQIKKLFTGGVLSFVLLLSVICVTPDASNAYILNRWVFDATGGYTVSTGYRNLSAVGQSTPLGAATSTGYRNYPGFLHSIAAEGNLLPRYTVSLIFAGSGTGMVTSTPAGIQCNVNCSADFNSYFPVTLTPSAGQYMIFTGWSGGCSGTATCTLNLTGNTSVTAMFDNDSAHAVYLPGSGTYYSTLQAAYNGASADATIAAWATSYSENLICDQPKSVMVKGGYDQTYTSQVDYTILIGTLIISQGTLVVDRLAIQ